MAWRMRSAATRGLAARVRHRDCELFAAITRQHIGGSGAATNSCGDHPEQLRSRGMAEPVIDLHQTVDVDHQSVNGTR
jgi:hypothetical protein